MKSKGTAARLLVYLFLTCLSARAEETDDGLNLQQLNFPSGALLSYVHVTLDKYDVRVLTPLVPKLTIGSDPQPAQSVERKARGLYLYDYRRRYNASVVVSGGYIASFSPPQPLGLVKSNGILTSATHDTWLTEGMFCSDQGRVIIALKSASVAGDFRDCVQAGPILLLNGKPPTDVPSVHAPGYAKLAGAIQEQTFVCVDKLGGVTLGVTDKIPMQELVSALQRPELGCSDALRLTGLDTSGLRIGKQLVGQDGYLFPSAVAVIPRAGENAVGGNIGSQP